MKAVRVLLVDDLPDDRLAASRALVRAIPGVDVVEIASFDALDQALRAADMPVVVTDYDLGWTTGLDVLDHVKRHRPELPVVMFTGSGNEGVCAEGLRRGLFDYMIKRPPEYARLPRVVRAAAEDLALRRRLATQEADLRRHAAELEALLDRERQARADAEAARAEAERANRVKDELLAIVSHELRTPLNSILAWAQILAAPARPLDARKVAHALEVIERNARAQSHLVDDLIEMSTLAVGPAEVDHRPVDLVAAAAAAVAANRAAIASKSQTLRVAMAASVRVSGDAPRLVQLTGKLLQNAWKFTPPGGHIELRVERSAGEAHLVVSDDGEGIAPEQLDAIFEPFRQADGSVRRQHGGLGLGLAIVKRLAEAQGGRVRATSAGLGRGASFTVALPLAPSDR